MARKWIKNVSLNGKICDIAVENGKFSAIGRADADGVDFGGNKIYPGLIDIHIHGCIGLDTMDGGLEEMSRWLLEKGTTTWYPTTMSMSEDDTVRATDVDPSKIGGACIPGFHMEGPFINKKYKGAMNEEFIIPPSRDFFDKCKNVKRITVAPETDGCIEFIKNCPVQTSIGHTDADYDTVTRALDAGATSLTHTYNVMPGIHHRAPGPIGAGFDAGAYAELICDGVHVHPSAVRMLIALFGTDRTVLVSDAMRAAGLCDGEYSFGGQTVIVRGGIARTAEGNLAGSTATLFDCVKTAISFGIAETDAVKMASEVPARLMGLNKGKIEVGLDADFIIVDESFNLVKSVVGGNF